MEAKLRQRVIGAAVLTSLAVIAVPTLLDGSSEDRARVVADIPDPPRIELREMSVEDITRKMQQLERDSAVRLPKEVVDETNYENAESFRLDQNNLPVAWSLQLGSFENQENAARLRAELRDMGHMSYVLHTRTSAGDNYKVLVGPMMERASLEKTGDQIRDQKGIEGHIVRYRVEDDATQLGG